MKNINEVSTEHINIIVEYAANLVTSAQVAKVFDTTEEVIRDAIDYCNFIRRCENLEEEPNGIGYADESEFDALILELVNRIEETK